MFRKSLKINIWLLLILGGGAFLAGSYFYRIGGYDKVKSMLASDEPGSESAGNFESQPLATLELSLDDSSMGVLREDRAVALSIGHLFEENRHKVPGLLKWGDEGSVKVKARLKGDRPDHWSDENRWSFRVTAKGGTYNGMKKFNVQRAATRGFTDEWLFHRMLANEGLIHLRYDFVNFSVNGKSLGVYAVEEQFDKRLIENNELREGPIFKFNTAVFWYGKPGHGTYLEGAPLEPYSIGKKKADNPIYGKFLVAVNLVEAYRRNEIPVSKVFDISKLAKYMAIIDLTGHHHASLLENVRFYFNPITSLIEPIGYDNSKIKNLQGEYLLGTGNVLGERRFLDLGQEAADGKEPRMRNWYQKLFSSTEFVEEYMNALDEISNEQRLNTWIDSIKNDYERVNYFLKKDAQWYQGEPLETLQANAKYLRDLLTPLDAVHAYAANNRKEWKDTFSLVFENVHSLPLKINYVKYKDSLISAPYGDAILQPAGTQASHLSVTTIDFPADTSMNFGRKFYKRVEVNFSILGASDSMTASVFPWEQYDWAAIEAVAELKSSNLAELEFLEHDVASGAVVMKPGDWTLSESLVIPAGKHLHISEGTTIKLVDSASIVSHSPVSIIGSSDNPVVIYSDSTLYGQALVVLGAGQESEVKHCVFLGLSRFKVGNWELPGAVNFYESPVRISHTTFKRNYVGDDFLNIVRSDFRLQESHFEEVNSDAFDGDFVSGLISDVTFNDVGNDGIDFSGSNIRVLNCTFDGIGDKAISGGERSQLACKEITVKNAELAVTSKDRTVVEVTGLKMENCKVGYTIFVKKSEFGAAVMRILQAESKNVEVPFLLEKGSQLFIDGKEVESNHDDVKSVLYGQDYGKSSR